MPHTSCVTLDKSLNFEPQFPHLQNIIMKVSMCSSIETWLNILYFKHKVEYYTAIKSMQLLSM